MKASSTYPRSLLIILVTVICAVPISTRGATKASDSSGNATGSLIWPTVDHDRAHTGRSQFVTTSNPGKQKWKFATGGGLASPVIAADGTIYVGSADFNLYAISPDGTRKWMLTTDASVGSAAIGPDGVIYVGVGENLYAVNPNGTKKWYSRSALV